jgi:bifunctional non-homologous end joining protein LigD
MKWSPGQLKPMEPHPFPNPFDSDKHVFEIKWDGMRLLAFIKGSEVRLQNRNLKERTAYFPELKNLYELFHAREGILDGELVAVENDKPSFPLLMKRCTGSAASAASKADLIPLVYVPFDILYLDGRDLTTEPLIERKKILAESFESGANTILSPIFQEDGKSLFEMVKERGLEGVVAKGKNTPYLIGKKSRYWLKIKYRRRQAFVIGGYVISSGQLNSILLGAFWDNKLQYLGRVGSGFGKIEKDLLGLLQKVPSTNTPFEPQPRLKKNIQWVEPFITVEVEFQEWTPDLKLRQPVFIRLLNIPPQECRLILDNRNNNPLEKEK